MSKVSTKEFLSGLGARRCFSVYLGDAKTSVTVRAGLMRELQLFCSRRKIPVSDIVSMISKARPADGMPLSEAVSIVALMIKYEREAGLKSHV